MYYWTFVVRRAELAGRFLFALLVVSLAAGCSKSDSGASVSTATAPTPQQPAAVVVNSILVTASTATLTTRGATVQARAMALMSDGSSQDRTGSATWSSDNTAVATVGADGVVTAQSQGDANIVARVNNLQGSLFLGVRLNTSPAPVPSPSPSPGPTGNRTPDPPAGQRLPLPANAQAIIQQIAARAPDPVTQSCPRGIKYVTNPWLDFMVDELRKLDTRWGYNAKPNRGPADNNGFPVIAAGDEITYHYGAGADEGSPDVYSIDILIGHCGPTPSLTFRDFTGEEPVRWTGAGRF